MSEVKSQDEVAERTLPPVEKASDPILKLNFLSHGTLESRDLDKTRAFYTEFLGLEVVRTSPISMAVRLGGNHTYAVVLQKNKSDKMALLNHNGLDVSSDAEVDEAYEKVVKYTDKYGIQKVTKPILQHSTYSFYFWDRDGNCWEILTNPKGGYSWVFERGGDLEGKGHMDKGFKRPDS
jgi:catechol 2,3-dioxygenase-like lactoylglutathione lyase family enzyme